jgi:hypothetical protein
VAKDCVMALLDNLQPNDAFGLVVFDDVSTQTHTNAPHTQCARDHRREGVCVCLCRRWMWCRRCSW